jgi:hypothetical protein
MVTYVEGNEPVFYNSTSNKDLHIPLKIDKKDRIRITNHLKALIQRYNNDLIKNKTMIK